jgi:hypothetical protein
MKKAVLLLLFLLFFAQMSCKKCDGVTSEPLMSISYSGMRPVWATGYTKEGEKMPTLENRSTYDLPLNMANEEVFYVIQSEFEAKMRTDTLHFGYTKKLIYDDEYCGGRIRLSDFKIIYTTYSNVLFTTSFMSNGYFSVPEEKYLMVVNP